MNKNKSCSHVTLRIYDTEFALDLEDMMKKSKRNKQDFFLMLVEEGYKSLIEKNDNHSSCVLKKTDKEMDEKIDNIHDLLISSYLNENKKLDDMKMHDDGMLKLLSAIYNMYLSSIDCELQEDVERGKFDNVPYRFRHLRDMM